MNNNTIKAISAGMLAGSAALAISGAMNSGSTKKKMKKATKKAVNTFSDVVDNVSSMMK